jgi:hypothetical protein
VNVAAISNALDALGSVATMSASAAEWLAAFAARLGIDAPSEDECNDILALAGTAAHASERMAAPIACWLAAKAGLDPNQARELALHVAVPESSPSSSADDAEGASD